MSKRKISEVGDGHHGLKLKKRFTGHNLHTLIREANSYIPKVKLKAIKCIRKLFLPDRDPPIDELINGDLIPILVHCLKEHDNPDLQFDVACILKNITSGTPFQTQVVVSAGAIPLFLNLLNSEHLTICEQAVWTLGNIIADNPQLRDQLISSNIVTRLLLLINHFRPIQFMRNVIRLIVNLCHNQNPPLAKHVISELLIILNYLIINKDTIIVEDTVLALSLLTDGDNDQKQRIIESGIISHIIPLLSHKVVEVKTSALIALGNIIRGTDKQAQVVRDAGVLDHFPALLSHSNEKIFESESNVLKDKEVLVITELAMYEGNDQKKKFVINSSKIFHLCILLSCQDSQVIKVVLDGIQSILEIADSDVGKLCNLIEEYGGLDYIEQLQYHNNVEIYKVAFNLIERYFFGIPIDTNC